ncbi:lactococcin 972 family bacteriocin [Streptomyces sp. NPDC058268]|uniref:lactococcin 972 family bacteriocin n=1 Tax=Streptomyces sp. NPDC058268 TaxID=3346413 RepID=UPI0036EF68D0
MKILGKTLTLAATTVALTAGALSPATAVSTESPQPKEWGMVTIKIDPNSTSVTPMKVKNVGGGTWSYGTTVTAGRKRCYSNYMHGSKYHSSTAILGNVTDKDFADSGSTSNASAKSGAAYTCHAYWGTY